jgi:hypothetical protein
MLHSTGWLVLGLPIVGLTCGFLQTRSRIGSNVLAFGFL